MTKADQQQILAEVHAAYRDLCRLESAMDTAIEALGCLAEHIGHILTNIQQLAHAEETTDEPS